MKFDSLILDIDGTIWNTTGIVAQAWNLAMQDFATKHPCLPVLSPVTAQILQGQFGKPMDVIAQNLFPSLSKAQQDDLMDLCCVYEQKAISENTSDITFPGVIDSIKKLAALPGLRLFIVSNCQAGYIELTMAKNGIRDLITDFECFGNNGKSKAQNIRLIIERNGLKAPVYVGDTQGDCDSCKEAGIPFIWASYGFGTADTYYAKIEKFEEIENFV